jgi:hypothetical protein
VKRSARRRGTQEGEKRNAEIRGMKEVDECKTEGCEEWKREGREDSRRRGMHEGKNGGKSE